MKIEIYKIKKDKHDPHGPHQRIIIAPVSPSLQQKIWPPSLNEKRNP